MSDLFNNAYIESAKKTMSPEQIEEYKQIGENMYNGIDFVNADGTKETIPSEMMDAILYVLDSIRSGQHISTLDEREKDLLKNTYGNKWYKKFGYKRGDLDEIVTMPFFGTNNSTN